MKETKQLESSICLFTFKGKVFSRLHGLKVIHILLGPLLPPVVPLKSWLFFFFINFLLWEEKFQNFNKYLIARTHMEGHFASPRVPWVVIVSVHASSWSYRNSELLWTLLILSSLIQYFIVKVITYYVNFCLISST